MKSKPLSGEDQLGESPRCEAGRKLAAQKPLRTPQFQAFLDSLEPQPWKRKKLTVNWATCHFNPVPK